MSKKFICPTKAENKFALKINLDGTEVWMGCSEAVRNFARTAFKKDDELAFEYEKDQAGHYKITGKVTKAGNDSGYQSQPTPPPAVQSYTPSTPVIPVPVPPVRTNVYQSNSEGQRQGVILHAVSRSLIALQGHVNPNNIDAIIRQLYATYNSVVPEGE